MSRTNTAGGASNGASPFLRMAGFVGDSIVDGPGLRCTVFMQGCPHGCAGCHNPESHPFDGGEPISADALLERIHSFPLCRGVTFSGGEPFCQAAGLLPVAQKLRDSGYELAAYTGYTFEELLALGGDFIRFLKTLDVLVDGRFVLAQRDLSLLFRGSANQRILDVPASLKAGRAVWVTEERWTGIGD